jgi:GDP-L-fucose synthase
MDTYEKRVNWVGTYFDRVIFPAEMKNLKKIIVWDKSKLDGQPKRYLDMSRVKKDFEFEVKVEFREGLKRTIEWYKTKKEKYEN